MPEENHPLAAVHYFYLLKDDQEDLRKLWSFFTAKVAGTPEQPALPGLAQTEGGPAGYCRVVQHFRGEDLDLCLVMLADLSALQVLYHRPNGQSLKERWTEALGQVERDRRILDEGISTFGETTLLVAPGEEDTDFVKAAAAVSGAATVLRSDIDPASGGHPVLLNLIGPGDRRRDFFAIAARDPDTVISTAFPQADSLIKKLSRTTAYFEEQRNTITRERADVDREVGALLHRQVVVSATGKRPGADGLERQIDSLSRMFGVLATDSLLVRQAGDRLAGDIGLLEQALGRLTGKAGRTDEIGDHFLGRFRAELEAARGEIQNLDFSRRNAQAAIEVVRTQVELLRAGEEAAIQEQTKELLSRSLVLQKERLALQVAAGFVEFVLVFYYVLKSWEGIAGMEAVEHIPPVVRLAVVGSISAAAALGTHFLAQMLSSHSLRNRGLWLSVAVLVLSFTAMVILTITSS